MSPLKIKQPKIYYHGSRYEPTFKPGLILRPMKLLGKKSRLSLIDETLEKYRPTNMIPRYESVYMVDDPKWVEYAMFAGSPGPQIYVVEPIGLVERNDLAWYEALYALLSNRKTNKAGIDIKLNIEVIAKSYWSGRKFPHIKESLFEYRTRSATVKSECSANST